MRKHIQVSARLYNCREVSSLQEACCLAHSLARQGFVPAIRSGRHEIRPLDDIDQRIIELFNISRNWSRDKDFGRRQYVVFPLPLIVQGLEDLIVTASFEFFAPDYFLLHVGGLIDFEFKDQSALVEPFAKSLRELVVQLWRECKPDYGYVDESTANALDVRGAFCLELPSVSWINLFGLAYIEKYGKEFLLNIPGYKAQELPDGGIFNQLTSGFVVEEQREVQKVRAEVQDYFAAVELEVTCKAPYSLGSKRYRQKRVRERSMERYGTDEDFKEYLEQILGTTLVLGDGTRVKSIYVNWDLLTVSQREMALSYIKATIISDIKGHKDAAFRFEFNELPDDLNQMMGDLIGVDHPDFIYIQVSMD